MAATRRGKHHPNLKQQEASAAKSTTNEARALAKEVLQKRHVAEEHLPPLPLILCILACSGAAFVLAMRDFWTTGRSIAGPWDQAVLVRASDWVACLRTMGRNRVPVLNPFFISCVVTVVVAFRFVG
jgi:hypothetical protein